MKSPYQWLTVSGRVFISGIIPLLMITSLQVHSQILREPDPSMVVDRSMGNIMLVTRVKGSLYLDNFLMTELKGADTVFMINIHPGRHQVQFHSGGDSVSQELILPSAGAAWLTVNPGSITINDSIFNYNQIREMITGKRVLFRDKAWYNVTQFSLFTISLNSWKPDDSGHWPIFLGTTTGFQVVPGFSAGIGIAYARRDIVYQTSGFYGASFMPVFLDIRSHFNNKLVAPFLSFDIGYNFLLNGPAINSDLYKTQLVRGRIYVAPGFGFRIAVNHLVQIITSLEFHFEGYLLRRDDYYQSAYMKKNINSMIVNIGIGFQK